jgi:hypothetical protein
VAPLLLLSVLEKGNTRKEMKPEDKKHCLDLREKIKTFISCFSPSLSLA